MKKIILIALGLVFILSMTACSSGDSKGVESTENDWKVAFEESGFSQDEITEYEKMFSTVGITDFHDTEIIENGIMHIVTGKVYDSSNLQFNVTLEDRVIIYMELAGIPDQKTEAYINWRGKLKTKTVDSKTAVELYSDTEGGYLAVFDWDTKTVSEYEGS